LGCSDICRDSAINSTGSRALVIRHIAENFVQNEWVAQGGGPTYSWEYARSEIEFIVKSATDALIPIEVKSGKRTRAKSLGVYVQRYSPQKASN
jgi:predicted AAA+ superfamily ATPase